ncbi:hypothetical protein D3C78_1363010 [compost metagenome]
MASRLAVRISRLASSQSKPLSSESRAPASSNTVVSIHAADSRRRKPWASSRHSTPIRLAPKCDASIRRCGIRKPICSRRVSISGVAPENSRTTPERNTSTASTGAARSEAVRNASRVVNSRWASLINSRMHAASIGRIT